MLSPSLNAEYNEYAGILLKLFVTNSVQIYGKDFCVYNVHSLIHLAKDAEKISSLNEVNCFYFENYLSFLKRMLRKSNHSLQQVINRISEGREINIQVNACGTYVIRKSYNVVNDDRMFYRKMSYNGLLFSTTTGNNCAYLKNCKIMLIKSILFSQM